MRVTVCSVLIFILGSVAFGQTLPTEPPAPGSSLSSATLPLAGEEDYRIGTDDLLAIKVFEVPDLDSEVRVTATGFVSLPLLGVVGAAGRTPTELEADIAAALKDGLVNNPHVTVFVQEYGSQPVSIIGAVAEPGIYQIRGRKYLLDMLAMAGGLGDTAGKIIQIIRRPADAGTLPELAATETAQTIQIDIEQLFQQGRTELNVPILAGDVISVTQAGSIFVVGEVNGPGEFVLRNGRNVSVTQALALGSGFTRDAKKSESSIIRFLPDGSRVEIPIDLDKIIQNESEDVTMLPNDILFVPAAVAKAGAMRALDVAVSAVTSRLIWGF